MPRIRTQAQGELMAERKNPPGSAMTLANMRGLAVRRLLVSCLNDACRHQALINVSNYPPETEVPWFLKRAKCGKCGGKRGCPA